MNRCFDVLEKSLIFPVGSVPFETCHASNICFLRNGELAAAWFAGKKEGSDDVSVWTARTERGVWGSPVRTAHDIDEPHWNPVLYERADGTLILFYKVGRVIADWYTDYRTSDDCGKTFSGPQELVPGDRGGRGPVRCKVITLSDGSMLAGTSTEKGIWTAYADRSSDGGRTWALSGPVRIALKEQAAEVKSDIPLSAQSFTGRGVIQPTLWESAPGHVHMLLRSSEGEIYRADSADHGRTWSSAYATGLPNNNSGIDVVRMEDGLLVLCMNPVSENFGPRTPIILMVSADNGETWEEELILEDGPNPYSESSAEYSYPCVIARGSELCVTYTYNRRSIAFQRLVRRDAV